MRHHYSSDRRLKLSRGMKPSVGLAHCRQMPRLLNVTAMKAKPYSASYSQSCTQEECLHLTTERCGAECSLKLQPQAHKTETNPVRCHPTRGGQRTIGGSWLSPESIFHQLVLENRTQAWQKVLLPTSHLTFSSFLFMGTESRSPGWPQHHYESRMTLNF